MNRNHIITLEAYQAWHRQDEDDPEKRLPMPDPKAIGEAIDAVLELVGRLQRTADGAAVTMGDVVWYQHPKGPVYSMTLDEWTIKYGWTSRDADGLHVHQAVGTSYSTEAAIAACEMAVKEKP